MENFFQVDGLEIDRLLSDWRWLCPSPMTLVARNVFGDLFLQNEAGIVSWLDTATGKLSKVANFRSEFLEMASSDRKRRDWFVEEEAQSYAQRGLVPSPTQCIGFSVPAAVLPQSQIPRRVR